MPAYNISVRDIRPSGTFLKSGVVEMEYDLLRSGDVKRFQYTIVPESAGNYKSFHGYVNFYNVTGHRFNSSIDQTEVVVMPTRPQVFIYKTFKEDSNKPNRQIELSIINIGEIKAYNINVSDDVPLSYSLVAGETNMYYEVLLPGEKKTIEYNVSPISNTKFSISASLTYEDEIGNIYSKISDPLIFEPIVSTPNESNQSNQTIALIVILVAIAVLTLVYVKIKS